MSSTRSITRRKPPQERRAEILQTASQLAVSEGLERVTARRVADALGVFPGLINHYFRSADELVAAAFAHAAASERAEVFGHAEAAVTPIEQLRRLLRAWLDRDRDAISLLWLDAWQASRRRPALLTAVTEQMNADVDRLGPLLQRGHDIGDFHVEDPPATATRVFALIDGLSIQAAIRATIDYTTVGEMVLDTVERMLGLAPGALRE
jgi:AcrR family transcriptional regulator